MLWADLHLWGILIHLAAWIILTWCSPMYLILTPYPRANARPAALLSGSRSLAIQHVAISCYGLPTGMLRWPHTSNFGIKLGTLLQFLQACKLNTSRLYKQPEGKNLWRWEPLLGPIRSLLMTPPLISPLCDWSPPDCNLAILVSCRPY